MFDTVRLAFGRPSRQQTHYECRHCGTALSRSVARCPACESDEIAVYEL